MPSHLPQTLPHSHLSASPAEEQPVRRRISFYTYDDMLQSRPVAVNPLSDITSGTVEPEHLPVPTQGLGDLSRATSPTHPGTGSVAKTGAGARIDEAGFMDHQSAAKQTVEPAVAS